MTSSTCDPKAHQYSRNPFNDEGDPIGNAIGQMLKGKEGGVNIETRDFGVTKQLELAQQAGIVSNMSYENLEAYWLQNGMASVDKQGRLVGKDFGYKIGLAAATTETYLRQRGGAVRDLAGEFLRKVDGGVNATAEGMALAREMQGVGRVAEVMLGWKQKSGRSLAYQNKGGLRQLNEINIEIDQVIKDADKLDGVNTKFSEIAAKLGDPEQSGEAINMLIEMAEAVRYLDNPADIARATTGMTIAGNWWSTLFINGLLSNTNTLLTNVAALSYAVARPAMQIVGAQAFSIWAPGIKRQAMLEASASLGAMYEAAGDALLIGRRAFMEELPTHTKVDPDRGLGFNKTEARQLLGENANPGVIDVIGKVGQVVRLPGRALLGTDEVAKHLAIRGEVAARGVRRALRDGTDVTTREAMTKAVQEEMALAFNLDRKEVWQKYAMNSGVGDDYQAGQLAEYGRSIYTVAEEATFQQDNWLANKVNKVLKTAPALRPFFPFIKTPTNILITGFDSLGVGAVGNVFNIAKQNSFNPSTTLLGIQRKLLQDPSQSALYAGQVATMSLIITTVWGQVMSGNMTGGGPAVYMPQGRRKEAQYAWKMQGNEAYTWKTPAGDIPFARMPEPFATVMRMAADLGSFSAYMTTEEQDVAIGSLTGLMATSVFDASFFGSLHSFLDVLGDPSRFDRNLGKIAQDYAATQVPFGGLLSQIDRANDPYKGIIEPVGIFEMWKIHENLFSNGILAKVADRMPGVKRPQLIDPVSGQPVFIYPGYGPQGMNPYEMSIPMFPRNIKGDEAYDVLFKVTGGFTEYNGGTKLTEAEQQQLNLLTSKVRIGGVSLQDAIIKFGKRPDVAEYMRLKGNTTLNVRTKIQDELNKITRRYETIAYRDLVQSNDNVMLRETKAEEIKRQKKAGNWQQQQRQQTELDELFNRARRGY